MKAILCIICHEDNMDAKKVLENARGKLDEAKYFLQHLQHDNARSQRLGQRHMVKVNTGSGSGTIRLNGMDRMS